MGLSTLTPYEMWQGRIDEKKGEGAARLLYVTRHYATDDRTTSASYHHLLFYWVSGIKQQSCICGTVALVAVLAFELRPTYYRYHMEYRFGAEQQS